MAKARNRQVNIRLTSEELERLRAACVIAGVRSVSEFARSAVFRSVNLLTAPPAQPADTAQLTDVYQRLAERLESACRLLEERLERLSNKGRSAAE